jgi:hypothetical protein
MRWTFMIGTLSVPSSTRCRHWLPLRQGSRFGSQPVPRRERAGQKSGSSHHG